MDWHIWLIIGVLVFILEIFTPTMFFINLAIAALLTAIPAFYGMNLMIQVTFFGVLSVILIIFLRPLLVGWREANGVGTHEKYVGSLAKVVTEVTQKSGRIAVFGEEWDARIEGKQTIPAGTDVVITANKNNVMFVKCFEEK